MPCSLLKFLLYIVVCFAVHVGIRAAIDYENTNLKMEKIFKTDFKSI